LSALPATPLPVGVTPPRPSGPPHLCSRYPEDAVRAGVSGTTTIDFTVTKEGGVKDVVVEQSSGSNLLDEDAKVCAEGWQFYPAMQNGQPIEFSRRASVAWKLGRGELPLPDSAQAATFIQFPVKKPAILVNCEGWHLHKDSSAVLAFDVETDGSVKDVTLLQSSGNTTVDRDAVECVAKHSYWPAMKNGQPIEVRLTATMY
jgi:TonB family protein